MAVLSGGEIMARQLKIEGVEVVFNLPGDPMTAVQAALVKQGTRLVNSRHEQANTLAAQAYAYALRKPGVAMAAGGPAVTNTLTGLVTAQAACLPVMLIGGSGEMDKRFRGDFQEVPQLTMAAPACKWAVEINDPRQIPYYVHTGIQKMMNGRPGPIYLDLPSNVIDGRGGRADESEIEFYPANGEPVRPPADQQSIRQAMQLISKAERPLLLIGKGVAWSDGAEEARQLVDHLQIPFVPSPMGKGTIPDDHPLNASSARTYALQNADLVILAGARFNWIFHFGAAPRFSPNVKVVQIDIEQSEIGNGRPIDVGVVGDAKVVLGQLLQEAGRQKRSIETPWLQALEAEKKKNAAAVEPMMNSDAAPMNMYRMYRTITEVIDRDATITADGENTMAISRSALPNFLPRHRIDAAESGCMGVSTPYAIGMQVARPGKQVISMNGDYAFGWNGFEAETAVRNKLPIVFIVANNVSVGGPGRFELGGSATAKSEGQPQGIRYDRIMQEFGGHGEFVETPAQLRPALERSLKSGQASLINVVINVERGFRKQQTYSWMTSRTSRMQY